ASAITQALHWLNPPSGTILHVRSVETQGGRTTTRELWQSADHPEPARQLIEGTHTCEASGDSLYDPATNTIYDAPGAPAGAGAGTRAKAKSGPTKVAAAGMPRTGK